MTDTPEEPAWLRRSYRSQAKYLDTAGNIASGHAMYGLANQCWALASRLREQSRRGGMLEHNDGD